MSYPWPAGYPRRGAWRFRNVTQGFDFTPTLDSIEIVQEHPEGAATLSFMVVDEDGSLGVDAFVNEDRIWVTFTKSGGTIKRIFQGFAKVVTEGSLSEFGPRTYTVEAQDLTPKLDDSVIDTPGDRAAESNADRVTWILSHLNLTITTTNVSPPGGTSEKQSYFGMTVREALDQFAEENDCHYYLDFGPEDPTSGNTPDLHLFTTETLTAPFDLSTEPDYATSFPFSSWERSKESTDLATAVLVIGENEASAWVSDSGLIATWGRQERSLQDETLRTATAIGKAGAQAITRDGQPAVEGSLVCWEPGLRAGMRVAVTNALWGITARNVWLESVTITAVDPEDADGLAYLRTEASFTERRRLKGSGRSKPPKGDTNGDAGNGTGAGTLTITALQSVSDDLDGDNWSGLFTAGAPYVGSWISQNTAYSVSGCALGGGLWGPGGVEWEAWYTVTATGTSGDSGAVATIGALGTLLGAGDPGPYRIGWANAAPSSLGDFTEVGSVYASGGEVFVPSWLIDDGGTNYLVIAPGFHAAQGWSTCAENISSPFSGPVVGGEGGSGRGIAPGTGSHSLAAVAASGPGRTPWHFPAGAGDIDGTNATFVLADWNGEGVPEARWGVAILAPGYDFDYDEGTQEVTFRDPPPAGTAVGFRYRED